MDHAFTAQDITKHLAGLQASSDVIDSIIAHGTIEDGNRDTMERNVRHIDIMCAMPHLADLNLSSCASVASRGRQWLMEQ